MEVCLRRIYVEVRSNLDSHTGRLFEATTGVGDWIFKSIIKDNLNFFLKNKLARKAVICVETFSGSVSSSFYHDPRKEGGASLGEGGQILHRVI